MATAQFLTAAFVTALPVIALATNEPNLRTATTCEALLSEYMPQFLALTPQDFDFDKSKGWRKLSALKCHREAAEALSQYVQAREAPYHVYFHAGQLLATAGQNARALEMLQQSLRPGYDETPFKWNAYVRAVQAFLRQDRPSLIHERGVLASRVDVKGNEANLRVVDKLVENFGASYQAAVKDLE